MFFVKLPLSCMLFSILLSSSLVGFKSMVEFYDDSSAKAYKEATYYAVILPKTGDLL